MKNKYTATLYDNSPVILAIDTEQGYWSKTITLYNRRAGLSFTFDSAEKAREFAAYWYANPIAAMFAYEMSQTPSPVTEVL